MLGRINVEGFAVWSSSDCVDLRATSGGFVPRKVLAIVFDLGVSDVDRKPGSSSTQQ